MPAWSLVVEKKEPLSRDVEIFIRTPTFLQCCRGRFCCRGSCRNPVLGAVFFGAGMPQPPPEPAGRGPSGRALAKRTKTDKVRHARVRERERESAAGVGRGGSPVQSARARGGAAPSRRVAWGESLARGGRLCPSCPLCPKLACGGNAARAGALRPHPMVDPPAASPRNTPGALVVHASTFLGPVADEWSVFLLLFLFSCA